jgi:DNA invertase Pin-like site-specific DNA recombinase
MKEIWGCPLIKVSNLETIEGIIQAAQERKIPNGSVMIIEALDRLTRTELDDAYQLFRRVLKAGIEIYTDRTDRHLTAADLNNPMSLMMTVVELDAAFQYSDKLSDRVGKAWRQKKARAADGIKLTAMAPAWVEVDRKTNIIKTNEKAKIVRRIFDSYAKGKGIRTIMRELNADKVPTFGKGNQNRGNGWASTHLRRLLSFRGVIGEYQPCKSVGRIRQPDGAPIADYYPAVVDKATFYKVQQILSRNGHAGGCKRNATNLFTGFVKCAKCGASMVIKHSPAQKGRYHYVSLVCNNALRGNGCEYYTIQYQYVERAVLTTLWVRVLPLMSGADTRKDQLCAMEGQLRDTETQIKKWMKLIDESENPPANSMRRLNALETRQIALNRQIESLSATINNNPITGWQQVPRTIENRLRLQTILRNEIDSLTIDAQNRVAILRMKESKALEGCFELAWESSSANGTKKNSASRRFLLWGDAQEYWTKC